MIVSKFTQVRDNFKSYCDKAHDEGETVIISRKENKNVVLISESKYNKMLKKISTLIQKSKVQT